MIPVLILASSLLAFAVPSRGETLVDERTSAEHQAELLIAERIDAERKRFAPMAAKLESDPALTAIARTRSDAMAEGAPFSHQDSRGRYPGTDMVHAHYGRYGAVGENLMQAYDSRGFDAEDFAERAVSGWMKSKGHRANILSPDYESSGIGVAINGPNAFATQIFRGAPKSARYQ